MSKKIITANDAWKKLIEKYDIVNKVATKGIFHIKASEIKEFKEPRLMAKWDCKAALPSILKNKNLNILPNSRNSYVLGDFLLYKEIPELNEPVNKMDYVELPSYETIDINKISSEAAQRSLNQESPAFTHGECQVDWTGNKVYINEEKDHIRIVNYNTPNEVINYYTIDKGENETIEK